MTVSVSPVVIQSSVELSSSHLSVMALLMLRIWCGCLPGVGDAKQLAKQGMKKANEAADDAKKKAEEAADDAKREAEEQLADAKGRVSGLMGSTSVEAEGLSKNLALLKEQKAAKAAKGPTLKLGRLTFKKKKKDTKQGDNQSIEGTSGDIVYE